MGDKLSEADVATSNSTDKKISLTRVSEKLHCLSEGIESCDVNSPNVDVTVPEFGSDSQSLTLATETSKEQSGAAEKQQDGGATCKTTTRSESLLEPNVISQTNADALEITSKSTESQSEHGERRQISSVTSQADGDTVTVETELLSTDCTDKATEEATSESRSITSDVVREYSSKTSVPDESVDVTSQVADEIASDIINEVTSVLARNVTNESAADESDARKDSADTAAAVASAVTSSEVPSDKAASLAEESDCSLAKNVTDSVSQSKQPTQEIVSADAKVSPCVKPTENASSESSTADAKSSTRSDSVDTGAIGLLQTGDKSAVDNSAVAEVQLTESASPAASPDKPVLSPASCTRKGRNNRSITKSLTSPEHSKISPQKLQQLRTEKMRKRKRSGENESESDGETEPVERKLIRSESELSETSSQSEGEAKEDGPPTKRRRDKFLKKRKPVRQRTTDRLVYDMVVFPHS